MFLGEVGSPHSSEEAGETRWSEGGDGLRRRKHRQLLMAFADSPQGGGDARPSDVSEGRSFLLHTVKSERVEVSGTGTDDRGRLLEEVTAPANLARALLRVARNKGAAGVDGQSVDDVIRVARKLLPQLRRSLMEETYIPGDVRRVWIPKPGGGQRGLGIPNVMDRWVQQAVHQILEPIFDPEFHDSSHGFRKDHGAKTALDDVRRHLSAGYVWLVNIDLSKFFDQVNHQRLLDRLRGRVNDRRVRKLVHRTLKAKVCMPDGVCVTTTEGTPQGGPLSPLLSNIVLDELDWELERRGLRFVRYADDFIVFARSERAALRILESTTRFITKRLRLKVNEEKSTISGPDDTHFLGFRFKRQPDGGVEVHLSKRSVDRLALRVRELTPRAWGQSLKVCMEQVGQYIRGWMAHFRLLTHEGTRILLGIDARVRRRLRAIVIRQRGRDRHLFRHLIKRGATRREAATTAFCRRSIWRRSITRGIHKAYPNAWFSSFRIAAMSEWTRLQPSSPVLQQLLLFPRPQSKEPYVRPTSTVL